MIFFYRDWNGYVEFQKVCVNLPNIWVNFIFLCKLCTETRCFLENITQLETIQYNTIIITEIQITTTISTITPTFGWASILQGTNINTTTQQQYKQQHLPVDGRAPCKAPTITQKHNKNINNNIYLWMGKHLARHQQLLAKRGLKAGRRPSTDWFVWGRKISIKSYWLYLFLIRRC